MQKQTPNSANFGVLELASIDKEFNLLYLKEANIQMANDCFAVYTVSLVVQVFSTHFYKVQISFGLYMF